MNKINLTRYDQKFCEKIKDYKKIHLKPESGTFYTITCGNKKCGVIGFIQKGSSCFLKIGIHEDFRGFGIFGKALNLLVKKHKIKKAYSTIAQTNIASIKSHKKTGFRRIPMRTEKRLKTRGFLLKRNIRLVKSFIK